MRNFWNELVAVLTCSGAVVLAAQNTTPPAMQTRDSTIEKVVVTGCVQRVDQAAVAAPVGTSGSTVPTTRDPTTKFILTDARGKSTWTAATSPATISSSYRLDADEILVLPHDGHTVEITGVLEPDLPPTAEALFKGPTLKVESVKLVSTSCP